MIFLKNIRNIRNIRNQCYEDTQIWNDVGKNILTLSGKKIPINEKPIEVAPYESKIYQIKNLSNKGKHLLVTGKNITSGIVESKPTLTLATCNGTIFLRAK